MPVSPRTKRPFQRICEFTSKHGAKAIVVHHEVQSEEWFQDSYKTIKAYLLDVKKHVRVLDVAQVTFLSCKRYSIDTNSYPRGFNQDALLGVCIVIKLQTLRDIGIFSTGEICSFVFEALMRLPHDLKSDESDKSLMEDFYHIFYSKARVCVGGRNLTIPHPVSFFCQSDGIISGCAQSSLRMTLRYSDDPRHKMISYRQMNKLVEHLGSQERIANSFDTNQIRQVLDANKIDSRTLWLDCAKDLLKSPYEFAYLLVESGIPTLLIFDPLIDKASLEPTHHMMFVLGHTISYHEWVPTALSFYLDFDASLTEKLHRGYIPSSRWVPHLIVHDDLLGPYHCLKEFDLMRLETSVDRKELRRVLEIFKDRPRRKISEIIKTVTPQLRARIEHVIGLVPRKMGFTQHPYMMQEIAGLTFESQWHEHISKVAGPWAKRLDHDDGPLRNRKKRILRTQLISRKDYIKHIQYPDGSGKNSRISRKDTVTLKEKLPEKFWMAEFTCPEVFTVHAAKLGEILLKFAPSEEDLTNFENGRNNICFGFRLLNYFQLETNRRKLIEFSFKYKSHSKLYSRQRQAVEY